MERKQFRYKLLFDHWQTEQEEMIAEQRKKGLGPEVEEELEAELSGLEEGKIVKEWNLNVWQGKCKSKLEMYNLIQNKMKWMEEQIVWTE